MMLAYFTALFWSDQNFQAQGFGSGVSPPELPYVPARVSFGAVPGSFDQQK